MKLNILHAFGSFYFFFFKIYIYIFLSFVYFTWYRIVVKKTDIRTTTLGSKNNYAFRNSIQFTNYLTNYASPGII